MPNINMWFLDVGSEDCTYLELPNGARMMIDCGGSNHWPSLLLNAYGMTKKKNPVVIPGRLDSQYGIDNLVITHPHGDHYSDIKMIHDDIGFFLLTGGYTPFIDKLDKTKMDYRNESATEAFLEVVKAYKGTYVESEDRIEQAKPGCLVKKKRFIEFEEGVDYNDLSWMITIEIGRNKVLFTGDMTKSGINSILGSSRAQEFKDFVAGTTIIKIPHHGRENACSQELFDCIGSKPLLGIISDEEINDRNESTASTSWYSSRISDEQLLIDGELQSRKVLTTRKDKDICIAISDQGGIVIKTNCFSGVKDSILK